MIIRFSKDVKWLLSLRENNRIVAMIAFAAGVVLFGWVFYDLFF